MSYIDRLNAITSQKQPEGSLTVPTQPPDEGQVSVVSAPCVGTFTKPREVLAAWRAHLMRMDPTKPLHGLSPARWAGLVDDADWLFEHYAVRAATDGWSALDLFGVLLGRDGWGGIACRLRASRSLVMGGEVATWRRVINGEPETFPRGLGKASGFTLIWEANNGQDI